jgi:divalent metal cation (Fe/Co/Zn/Cd) transporter
LILQSNDYEKLQNIKHFTFEDKVATLNVLNIKSSTEQSVVIEAEIVAETSLSTKEYAQIKNQLEKKMGKNVSLHVIPKIVIE